ncbi:hypothetical protein TNCV_4123111 [Trichonephila clavipes]|nr:hypothetical protein TNCV_4123111 [Trichonephila clavipes]
MNCQTKLRINHLTAVKLVAILESNANLNFYIWKRNILYWSDSLVYADKPQTLDHLEDNIRRVIADRRPQMLEKVIENWTSRLDYIRASRSSPMPEIIFKMLLLNSTNKFRGVLIGSIWTTNHNRTWRCKSRLVGEYQDNSSHQEDEEPDEGIGRNEGSDLKRRDKVEAICTYANSAFHLELLQFGLQLLGLGTNPEESMHVCKCILPSRHDVTVRSRWAPSPFIRLMEGEERWEVSDHYQSVSLKIGVETS